jgi:probable rRNA maturation factor
VTVQVDIQSASNEPAPDEEDIRHWITAALSGRTGEAPTELTVRVVDVQEMTSLNETYRGKTGPTNVLSFPAGLPEELTHPLLGDIVICAPVVRREAAEQGKDITAHWAHMTIHGVLHLLGYDHIKEKEAIAMEALETDILATFNISCPYEGTVQQESIS